MIIVHYEVYVLEGRGWMLHARFPRTEREGAVAEAREVEQTLGVRVKVLRETYYTDDNAFEEAEIYVSGMKMPAAPRPAAAAGAARSKSATSPPRRARAAAAPASSRPRRPSAREVEAAAKARQLFGRLFAIVAVGLAVAMLAIRLTPEAILLIWKMGFAVSITPQSYSKMLFAVFVLSFLMVAVPLAIRFLPRKTRMPEFHKPSFSWAGTSDAAKPPPEDIAHQRAIKKSLNKLAAQSLAAERQTAQSPPLDADKKGVEVADKPVPAAPPAAVADDDLPEILPGPDEILPEIRSDQSDLAASMEAMAKEQLRAALAEPPAAAPTPAPEQPKPEVKTETPPQPKENPPPAATPKDDTQEQKDKKEAETADSLQPTVMRFLNGAVNQAKAIMPNMDAYTKFALHLYLAGAVESLCEFKKLGEAAKSKLVTLALETLGTKGELARKFYEKIEEYLLEPRYLGVVQAGRNAMGDFMLGDETGAHQSLRDVFAEWNRKSDKKAQIVTVMFTDMVGSTDMTQARGDAAAQEVVRRHNAIVRGALAQFGGKEIKHTGDGIMASFATSAAAVEASIAIQRQVSQHNKRQATSDLHLRIGLNAGEPIEEEDDLFGTTVQLAARICAATNPDQILCTGVVKDLAFGKGAATYRPMGEKFLKGFKDAIPTFEVVWNA